MTEVKCKVSSCHYWGQGDVCKADTILIDQDQMRADTTRDSRLQRNRHTMETGTIGATDTPEGHSVRTSEATCCGTFRPKGSPKLS